jgi:hypothetical protein
VTDQFFNRPIQVTVTDRVAFEVLLVEDLLDCKGKLGAQRSFQCRKKFRPFTLQHLMLFPLHSNHLHICAQARMGTTHKAIPRNARGRVGKRHTRRLKAEHASGRKRREDQHRGLGRVQVADSIGASVSAFLDRADQIGQVQDTDRKVLQ